MATRNCGSSTNVEGGHKRWRLAIKPPSLINLYPRNIHLCTACEVYTFVRHICMQNCIFHRLTLTPQKVSGSIFVIPRHMNIPRILRRELLSTQVTVVQETAREVNTFNMVQHIRSLSIFGATDGALILVVLVLLEVFCQHFPRLYPWADNIHK